MSFNSTPNLPSNLYTGGAVKFDTRQLANMLYQEERMRRMEQAKRDAELRDQVDSEMSNVLAVDKPDAVRLYDEWKKSRISLSDPKLQRNRDAFAAAQAAEQANRINYFKLTKGSAERKDFIKSIQSLKPEDRADAYGDYMSTYMNTPLSKLQKTKIGDKEVDLSNPDSFRYTGVDYDPSKIYQAARGDLKTLEIDEGVADKQGLTNNVSTYESFRNSPAQFKDNLINGMAGDRQARRLFDRKVAELTPQEIERVNKQYESIPADEWRKRGIDKQDLKVDNPDNPYDVVATYEAKKFAIENMARKVKTEPRINKGREMELQQQNRMAVAAFNKRANEDLAKMKQGWKNKGETEQKATMSAFVDDMIGTAKKRKPIKYIDGDGRNIEVYQISATPSMKKAYETFNQYGDKVRPDFFAVDKNDNVYPMFYERVKYGEKSGEMVKEGGRYKVSKMLVQPFKKNTLVAELSNEMLSPSKVELDVEEDEDSPATSAPTPPAKPSSDWRSRATKVN
jgi:hypothetical protein